MILSILTTNNMPKKKTNTYEDYLQSIKTLVAIEAGKKILDKGFICFFNYFYKEIYNKKPKNMRQPARKKLMDAFVNFEKNKEYRFLVINALPRIGKTTIASFFMAYYLAKDNTRKIIYTSYSNELLQSCSNSLRTIMTCEDYILMFGANIEDVINEIEEQGKHTIIKEDLTKRKDVFNSKLFFLKNGGQVRFASMKSAITGFGCDIAICDDPNNPADRFSQKVKDNAKNFFVNVLNSRLDDKKTGRIMCLQQRVARDDVSGYLLSRPEYKYKHIKIPLIDDNNECTLPDEYGEEEIKWVQADKLNYLCQYQQEPPRIEGMAIFERKEFEDWNNDLSNLHGLFITTDLSFTKDNDHLCYCMWGYTKQQENSNLILLDILYARFERNIDRIELLKSFVLKNKHFQEQGKKKIHLDYILIEENGNYPLMNDISKIQERVYLMNRNGKKGQFSGLKSDRAIRIWGYKPNIKLFNLPHLHGDDTFETACEEFNKTSIDIVGKAQATDDFIDNVMDAMIYCKYVI